MAFIINWFGSHKQYNVLSLVNKQVDDKQTVNEQKAIAQYEVYHLNQIKIV